MLHEDVGRHVQGVHCRGSDLRILVRRIERDGSVNRVVVRVDDVVRGARMVRVRAEHHLRDRARLHVCANAVLTPHFGAHQSERVERCRLVIFGIVLPELGHPVGVRERALFRRARPVQELDRLEVASLAVVRCFVEPLFLGAGEFLECRTTRRDVGGARRKMMAFVVAQRFAPIGKEEIRVDFLRFLKRLDRVFLLIMEALKEAGVESQIKWVKDGEEVMDYLNSITGSSSGGDENPPKPRLILLDLNMPRKDGREVLEEIKENSRLRQIPVIVLTTSKADVDVLHTYDLGVNSFIQKPVRFSDFVDVIKIMSHYWFNVVKLPA